MQIFSSKMETNNSISLLFQKWLLPLKPQWLPELVLIVLV